MRTARRYFADRENTLQFNGRDLLLNSYNAEVVQLLVPSNVYIGSLYIFLVTHIELVVIGSANEMNMPTRLRGCHAPVA